MVTQPNNAPRSQSTELRSISFEGIPSGDNESFCWDVTRETFIRVTGAEPDEEHDASYFNRGRFRLYPRDVLPVTDTQGNRSYKFTVHIEPATETTPDPSATGSGVKLSENSLPKVE